MSRYLVVIFWILSLSATAGETHNTWLDDTHQGTTSWLKRTAHHIDDWFGTTNPNQPARASLRVMLDLRHSDDGTTIKPRIRGKLRLPTLEQRLSVVIGDDKLDDEQGGGIYNDGRLNQAGKTFDYKQSQTDNSSLALRWSKFEQDLGIDTDADIGLRSNDLFIRLQGQKRWQMDKVQGRVEQMYRYGSQSEHFALSTLEFRLPQSTHRTLYNRANISYQHKNDDETISWSNSSYQEHRWQGKHGGHQFSYGLYMGGDIKHKQATLNTYGPYASYRQPIWREWLFIQTDVSFYNDDKQHKKHHLASFGRLEMVF